MAKINLEGIDLPQKSVEILKDTEKKMGFVPNMYQMMAPNVALLDGYLQAYNSFRSNSGFDSVEQEVIFLSVAYANSCEYCMSVHSFVADQWSKVPMEVTDAIRDGIEVPDKKLNMLSKITKAMTQTRGNISQEEVDKFIELGYTPAHLLGIIAGIAIKTMSNYSNHLTHPALDEPFASRKWTATSN